MQNDMAPCLAPTSKTLAWRGVMPPLWRNDGFVDSVCLRARKVSRNDSSSLPSRALLFVPVLRVIAPSCRIQVRNPNGFLS